LKGLNDSAAHLEMPTFDTEEMIGCLKPLVQMDRDWLNIDSTKAD